MHTRWGAREEGRAGTDGVGPEDPVQDLLAVLA